MAYYCKIKTSTILFSVEKILYLRKCKYNITENLKMSKLIYHIYHLMPVTIFALIYKH